MDYVKIGEFKHIGQDNRGITREFSLARKQQNFMFITRNKGTVSGNSYHAGKTEGTNPKLFILLSGDIEFSYRRLATTERNTLTLSAPLIIEVKPNVIHSVKAITDIILMECNSLADIQQDVVKEEV